MTPEQRQERIESLKGDLNAYRQGWIGSYPELSAEDKEDIANIKAEIRALEAEAA